MLMFNYIRKKYRLLFTDGEKYRIKGTRKRCSIYSQFDGYIPLHPVSYSEWESMVLSEFSKLETIRMINPICIKKLRCFLKDVFLNYDEDVPFHNQNHVLEVFQFGMCLLQRHRNMLWSVEFIHIETFCFALLLHDIGHTGLTNNELEINEVEIDYISDSSESSYASSFNEHNHVNIGSKLLEKHGLCYNKSLFNSLIYATDINHHNSFLLKYNPFFGNQLKTNESPVDIFKLFVKLSDIGHVLRPWKIHVNNVIKLNKERSNPLPLKELAADTISFNKIFVESLLDKLKDLNIGLYFKLYRCYCDNIGRWKIIDQFYEMSDVSY